MKKSTVLAIAAFGLFAGSNAQAQSNTTLNAYARIIRPIVVTELEELSFGALYATGSVQNVSINPNNATNSYENDALRSGAPLIGIINNPIVGGIHVVDASADVQDGDGIEQGGVRVAGEAGFNYQITASTTPLTPVSAVAGAANMALGNVKIALQGGAGSSTAPASFTLTPGSASIFSAASSTDDFNVGATMTVAANQGAGIYHGTITISAAYN